MRPTVRDVLAPSAAVLLLFAGSFKGNPLLAWLPADLTLVAAAGTALGIGFAFVARGGWFPRQALPVALLWACFMGGLFLASSNPYASEKGLRLFTLTLIAAIAPSYLVRSRIRQQSWVWLHGVVGVAVVLLSYLSPAQASLERFALEGSTTIAAGRATGAALVVAMLLIVTRAAPLALTLPLSLVMAGPLVASGSRGPVLAAVVAVFTVVAVSPTKGRTRLSRTLLTAGAFAAGSALLFQGGAGSARLESVFVEDPLAGDSFAARLALWRESLSASVRWPEGVGWGDLVDVLETSALGASGSTQYAHNVVLETLVEGGWLAAGATIVFIVAGLRRLRLTADDGFGAALFGLAVFFVVNAMVSGDINDNRTMWAALAMGWVVGLGRDADVTEPQRVDISSEQGHGISRQ